MRGTKEPPFWLRKRPAEMSQAEWESLCDGCGKCCLNKIEDEDTGRVFYTNLACKLLNHDSGRCSDYENRFKKVPDCIKLTPENVGDICLPKSCAYRLIYEGKGLPWWHPLVSGDAKTVNSAGMSVRKRVICETSVHEDDWDDYIVKWPERVRAVTAKPVKKV